MELGEEMDGKTEMSRLARDDWFCKEDKRGRVHVLKTREEEFFFLNVPVTTSCNGWKRLPNVCLRYLKGRRSHPLCVYRLTVGVQ